MAPGETFRVWEAGTSGFVRLDDSLPSRAAGDWLTPSAAGITLNRSSDRTPAVVEIVCEASSQGRQVAARFAAAGPITFLGVVPDGAHIVVGDETGDIAVCALEGFESTEGVTPT